MLNIGRTPTLPVQEFNKIFLETIDVHLNDTYLNSQIISALQKAGKFLTKPVVNLNTSTSPNGAEADAFAEIEETEFLDDNKNELLEIMTEAEVQQLETILSVFVTRQNFWNGVLRRGSHAERLLGQLGSLLDTLESHLAELKDLGWVHDKTFTEEEQKILPTALAKLKALSNEADGATERTLPDPLDELIMHLIEWWEVTVGTSPTFWDRSNGVGLNHKTSPFLWFLWTILDCLPAQVRPSKSRGKTGTSRNATANRYEQLKTKEVAEERFLALMRERLEGSTCGEK